MKKSIEITMKELHVGACKTVVSLQLDQNTELQEFMEAMIKSNPSGMKRLRSAMITIASVPNYTNKTKWRSVSDSGIYEIKTRGLRLYCFQDRLHDGSPCLIIATNGGNKNTKRQQNRDITRAAAIRAEYYTAKKNPSTELNYTPLPDEN